MADSKRQLEMLLLRKSFFLVICFYAVSVSANHRTREKMYIDIESYRSCFRVLNGTHQIGCSSKMDGNSGVVHYIQTEEDWTYVLEKGNTGPYVPVLDALNFTILNVRRLVHSGRVAGIAVLDTDAHRRALKEGFSADKSCPNDESGMYHGTSLGNCAKVVWNPAGDGLFFDDLDLPIVSIRDPADVKTILEKCWEPFNKPKEPGGAARSFPLCAMELKAPMIAAKNSVTCMRRLTGSAFSAPMERDWYCSPLGDRSVVATLKDVPSNETRGEKSVVVVAARMDALSMFLKEFPGGDSPVTGMVTLLAAAKALWTLQGEITALPQSKDVLFAFLQGEAFDYIGSSRVVYDMKRGRFPVDVDLTFRIRQGDLHLAAVNLSHVAQFVELSQVGMRQDGNSLWLHADPTVRTETEPLLDKLTSLGTLSNALFQSADPASPLPPASLQRFLKEAGASPFPSFVITDHQGPYTNKYYNSHWDLPSPIEADYPSGLNETEKYEADTVQSERITRLATALARYLFWAATNQQPDARQMASLQASKKDVNHMLYCFLHSPQCELFNFTVFPNDAQKLAENEEPYSLYVMSYVHSHPVTSLTRGLLAFFTGERLPNVTQADHCKAPGRDKRHTYLWMHGSEKFPGGPRTPLCCKTTATLTEAVSPAFIIEGYDMTSGQFSTWAESMYDPFSARVFLLPSMQFQVLTLCVGVSFLVTSLAAVYMVSSSIDALFESEAGEEAATSPTK